jgi:hypothetical protein
MTDELKAAIERVEHTLDYGYNEDLITADLRALIDAARQAEAWREVALAERKRCGSEAVKSILTAGDGVVAEALGQRLCCTGVHCGCRGATVEEFLIATVEADIRALPAPEPKGT